jgi:putative membrane protein
MATDLILAILHHFLIFAIAGIIFAETMIVRRGLTGETIPLLARIDGQYGLLAGAVILVGMGRVFFGLKGWEFYIYYWAFWAKMASFVAVGLLSIRPTLRFLRWRNAAAGDTAYAVPDAEIDAVRPYLGAEAVVFLLIPTFAAIMARGVGY